MLVAGTHSRGATGPFRYQRLWLTDKLRLASMLRPQMVGVLCSLQVALDSVESALMRSELVTLSHMTASIGFGCRADTRSYDLCSLRLLVQLMCTLVVALGDYGDSSPKYVVASLRRRFLDLLDWFLMAMSVFHHLLKRFFSCYLCNVHDEVLGSSGELLFQDPFLSLRDAFVEREAVLPSLSSISKGISRMSGRCSCTNGDGTFLLRPLHGLGWTSWFQHWERLLDLEREIIIHWLRRRGRGSAAIAIAIIIVRSGSASNGSLLLVSVLVAAESLRAYELALTVGTVEEAVRTRTSWRGRALLLLLRLRMMRFQSLMMRRRSI
ncbi:Zinc finger protein 2 [Senna tora]|uniref:Zinc finger protein 2 n=1 Tax=Senna tora TaxID=362788 RepID=A0A834VYT8_9FABA|nr:Zinc finger protein 2 [Senna tora]